MAKDLLGVEIGNTYLYISQISHGSVVRFYSAEIPEDAVIGDELVAFDAMVDVLKKAVHDGGFTTRKAALVVPDSATYVRRLKMPAMTEAQLKVNLPYEYRDLIQDDKEKYTFDYSMIGMINDENGTAREMELLGAAMSNELLENYIQMFARAGLKLVKAAPRMIALQELMHLLFKEEMKGDLAVLDLSIASTKVDIIRNGVYETTRSIEAGLWDVAQAIANDKNCDVHVARQYLMSRDEGALSSQACVDVYSSIAVEIRRALNYYTYEVRDNTLDKLYYSGIGAWDQAFVQEIADNVSLPLVPLTSASGAEGQALLAAPVTVGICLE